MSCKRDRDYHQLARDTWLKDCPVDYRFFLGEGQIGPLQEDEVLLPVGDYYRDAAQKMKAIIKWVLPKDYDYIFKCDVDTYVCIPRLLKSGFEQHRWSGYGGPPPYGGSGYWINRQAMEILSKSEIDSPAEDHWVGRNLNAAGWQPLQDKRYFSLTDEGPTVNNDHITAHWYPQPSDVRLGLFKKYYEAAKDLQ